MNLETTSGGGANYPEIIQNYDSQFHNSVRNNAETAMKTTIKEQKLFGSGERSANWCCFEARYYGEKRPEIGKQLQCNFRYNGTSI